MSDGLGLGRPSISVIMSVYNEQDYVRRAIDSILAQSYSDFELVIIDDGSIDNSAAVIAEYPDPRIRLLRQANQGLERALNRGILLSEGQYIARMDADDQSRPDRFAKQIDFLERRPGCGLVGSCCALLLEGERDLRHFRVPLTDRAIRRQIMWENPFVHSSVMMKRWVLDKAGPYRPEYRWGDYDLWCRVLEVCEAANLPDELVIRTVRRQGTYRGRKSAHYREKLRVQLSMPGRETAPVLSSLAIAQSGAAWGIHKCCELVREAWRQ